MNFTAFFSYIFLTAFTPGPNNIMAMYNAGKYGFKKGLRFNLGVLFGFFIVMTCCAVLTTMLYNLIPRIEPAMLCIGAAYILWLAWVVWRDKPHEGKKRTLKSNSIASGMILQFVNIKVILYGITAMSTFILPYYQGFAAVIAFILLLSFVGFAGTCCWALFGAVFEWFFSKYRRGMNVVMALLLVYCAASLLWELFK